MWLLLATAAEVPPMVCPKFLLEYPPLFTTIHQLTWQVLIALDLNGIVPFFFCMPTNHGGLNSILSQMPVPLDLVCSWFYDLGRL